MQAALPCSLPLLSSHFVSFSVGKRRRVLFVCRALQTLETQDLFPDTWEVSRSNRTLPIQEMHRLQAAEGWLGLGDHREAHQELESISATFRAHPAVLVIRCMVHYNAKNWPKVFELADTLTIAVPNDPFGWLQRSHALHFMGQTEKAWKGLLPVAKKFNLLYSVAYDLACYAAVLGKLEEARVFLHRAFAVADEPTKLKIFALEDPDLKNLWA